MFGVNMTFISSSEVKNVYFMSAEGTKSTKISSLFPKRGNRNTKRTEKHKNKMTHGKTYNKSPRRINHKATKSKTNTGTTALERSVDPDTQFCLTRSFVPWR